MFFLGLAIGIVIGAVFSVPIVKGVKMLSDKLSKKVSED